MKIKGLERHRYSPELNKLHLQNGIVLGVDGCTSIKEAKAMLFPRPLKGLYCRIYSEYDEKEHRWLNRLVASGRVGTRLQALQYSKQFKQNGGKLLSGDTLPPNKIRIEFIYN